MRYRVLNLGSLLDDYQNSLRTLQNKMDRAWGSIQNPGAILPQPQTLAPIPQPPPPPPSPPPPPNPVVTFNPPPRPGPMVATGYPKQPKSNTVTVMVPRKPPAAPTGLPPYAPPTVSTGIPPKPYEFPPPETSYPPIPPKTECPSGFTWTPSGCKPNVATPELPPLVIEPQVPSTPTGGGSLPVQTLPGTNPVGARGYRGAVATGGFGGLPGLEASGGSIAAGSGVLQGIRLGGPLLARPIRLARGYRL